MMTESERDMIRLKDILDEIGLIRESMSGITRDEFLSSEDKKAAVAHHLTIIGEAASHVRDEIQARYPLIAWHGIVGMRNVLVHQYGKVDYDEVWVVSHGDLDDLERNVKEALAAYPWSVT